LSRAGAVIAALALAGCFGPAYPEGLPCSERATCPPGHGCGLDGFCRSSSVALGSASDFVVGGTVAGLLGSGLVLDDGEPLSIAADGAFAFPTRRSLGRAYQVTVATQPTSPWQRCEVMRGTGVIDRDVDDVAVQCATERFTVGGNVVGLAVGSTLAIMEGADEPAGSTVVEVGADGPFAFPAPIASGHRYRITAGPPASPAPQRCTVENGEGTVAGAPITDVVVRCQTDGFHLGGTVSGLDGRVMLQDRSGALVPILRNGDFTFPGSMPVGHHYAVTVAVQPLGQRCHVFGGEGTIGMADVTSIAVSCGPCGDNLVPVMTSDTTPSGRVSASGVYPGGYDAWHAFDSDTSMWISAKNAPKTWIRYEWGDGPRWVARYGIHFVNGSDMVSRSPRDFSLWGLRGTLAVELDRRSGQIFGGSELRVFDIAQPGLYDGYELRVTDDNDARAGVVVISMGTLQLLGEACDTGPEP
jgi:hypothetical protein